VINSNGKTHEVIFRYDGIYNAYNCCAAIAFSIEAGLDINTIAERIENFEYKLGRMENIEFNDKMVKVVLVKNPIGLSEVLKSISNDQRKKSILFILNDNPADGTDVSWIWDADVEVIHNINNIESIHCSGIRAPDIALRLKYSEYNKKNVEINTNIEDSIETVLGKDVEIVYILPTYTAVYMTRDIIMGYLNHTNARIPRFREIIKSRIGN
jgi:UDP-N-acetylmuramyl tripeptide synthase